MGKYRNSTFQRSSRYEPSEIEEENGSFVNLSILAFVENRL